MKGGKGLQALTPAQIALLSPYEQEEYLEHLEALYYHERSKNIGLFARAIEVPGAPTPSESKASDIAKKVKTPGWKAPEPVEDEAFYTDKLCPAAHHDLILDVVQKLLDDTLYTPSGEPVDGAIITAPPGSAKSSYTSMIVPAFAMGYRPKTNVIAASYSQELSDSFSRRVRSIVSSAEYARIFPKATVNVAAVRHWTLGNASEYRSTGVGAGIAGFRCNLLIMDDLVASREDAESDIIREKTWNAINDDLLSRAKQDLFKIVAINTRFHEDDHIGRFLGTDYKGQSGHWRGRDGRNWYILNLPLHAEHPDDPLGRRPGQLLWPEWYKPRFGDMLKNDKTPQGIRRYASLYQQRPAPAEGSILLRSYWQEWKRKKNVIDQHGQIMEIPDPPECNELFLCYDTAFEEDEQDDPSAMTAWGIFDSVSTKLTGEQYNHEHAILLGAWEAHVQAADLADIIQEHYKHFRPRLILVEKRASGIQVIQELKRLRLPVRAWLPKGKPGAKGKIPRAHAVAMMLEQGSVWYIPGAKTEAVIDQCAQFPNARNDDLVDTCTMALSYLRDRFMFQTADEEMDGDEHKAYLQDQMDKNRMGRRLYNGDAPQRRAQNERRIYSESTSTRVQDDATERMTDETRRRLYGD
jgi:phage terminase large subunit-like protein